MNAAGVSPWRLLRPFLAAALRRFAFGRRHCRLCFAAQLARTARLGAQVRADILTNIVQPGRFTTVGGNLTFHIADRRPNGLLVGIFVDDRRDPNEHATYLAEQGEIVKNDNGVVPGPARRQHSAARGRPARSAHRDLRPLRIRSVAIHRRPRKTSSIPCARSIIWELLWPRADDALYASQPDQYRSELYDRLATPLYPIAFVILAFAFLGPPQTTRQSRTLALLGMVGTVSLLRLVGFVSVIVGVNVPGVLPCNMSRSSARLPRAYGKSRAVRPWSPRRPCRSSRPRSANASHGRRRRGAAR